MPFAPPPAAPPSRRRPQRRLRWPGTWSLLRVDDGGAVPAPPSGDRHRAQAVRALAFGRLLTALSERQEPAHRREHQEIDHRGDDEKRNRSVYEVTVGKFARGDREDEPGKVRLPAYRRDQRGNQILDQSRDDSGERDPDYYRDGEVDQATAHQELLEAFHARHPPRSRLVRQAEHGPTWVPVT